MENKKNNRHILPGILIAAIGGLLLLNNFDLLGFSITHYVFTWKSILIIVGLALMTSRKHLTGGVILASLGVVFWLPELFQHQFELGQIFLPAILVIIGITLLLKAGFKNKSSYTRYEEIESKELSSSDNQ